jgi:hypothetical protein
MHIHEAGALYAGINFYVTFLAQKSNQKTWRKLTRTIGLWILGGLCCGSRTIKICSFGNQVPSECCSNIDFRRWMCGFATGVDGWEVDFLICRSGRMKESAAVGGFVEGYEI